MIYLKLFEDFQHMIFYHGTNNKFDSFDEKYQLNGWLGKGFYFTDNKESAKEHGKYIMKVHLDIRNPFYVEGESPSDVYTEINQKLNSDRTDNDEISYLLKKNLYDGVVFKHWDKGYMYSCFYPNQIKIL